MKRESEGRGAGPNQVSFGPRTNVATILAPMSSDVPELNFDDFLLSYFVVKLPINIIKYDECTGTHNDQR